MNRAERLDMLNHLNACVNILSTVNNEGRLQTMELELLQALGDSLELFYLVDHD